MADDAALRRLRALAKQQIMSSYRHQERRWNDVLITIDAAKDQIVSMRQDAIEEGERDNSVPLWLSTLFIVGIGLFPIGTITTAALGGLTNYTRVLFGRAKFMVAGKLKRPVLVVDKIGESPRSAVKANLHKQLGPYSQEGYKKYHDAIKQQIRENDELAARIIQLEAVEIAAANRTLARQMVEAAYQSQFKIGKSQAIEKTDAPSVVISVVLKRWVNDMKLVEGLVLDKINFYIDTAEDLQESDVQKFVAELEAGMSSVPAAQNEVTMKDLQLLIESCIWASTFDFKPRPVPAREIRTRIDGTFRTAPGLEPIPLKPALWKRLIERYQDPDMERSYKELGPNNRLGTIDSPSLFADEMGRPGDLGKTPFSPEVRLSHFFSDVLGPRVQQEHQKFARDVLSSRP